MEVLYDTTKGAVHMFARAIAVEFSRQEHPLQRRVPRLRAHPARASRGEGASGAGRRRFGSRARRAAGPHLRTDEVAKAALFLASDEASLRQRRAAVRRQRLYGDLTERSEPHPQVQHAAARTIVGQHVGIAAARLGGEAAPKVVGAHEIGSSKARLPTLPPTHR